MGANERPTEPIVNLAKRKELLATTDEFLESIQLSGLLDKGQLDRSLADFSLKSSPREVADRLILKGQLTRYQADKLLRGIYRGLILGPYRVLAPLGRGGMGTVYLARRNDRFEMALSNEADRDLFALKVLPPRLAREEDKALQRFQREMEIGRHLDHPNITRTFDAQQIDGIYFIAMEYVRGKNLRQHVIQSIRLSVPKAAGIFADVASGLAHAHANGLIHRDLKPSNIMVEPSGRAKIVDLGLAMIEGETPPDDPRIIGAKGYVLGTMDFIAPEQISDPSTVGPAADLYSLGCSIYFCLTGSPPFPGGTSKQKIRWHKKEEAPELQTINPDIDLEFAKLVARLMAKDPAARPQSALALRELLLPWAMASVSQVVPSPVITASPPSITQTVAGFDQPELNPSAWSALPYEVMEVEPQSRKVDLTSHHPATTIPMQKLDDDPDQELIAQIENNFPMMVVIGLVGMLFLFLPILFNVLRKF